MLGIIVSCMFIVLWTEIKISVFSISLKGVPEVDKCIDLKWYYGITKNSMKERKRCLPFANICISSGDI